jgi:hypothetical protein
MFYATTINDLLFSSRLATPQTVEQVPDEVISLIYPASAPQHAGDLACTLADLDRALELTAPEEAAWVYDQRGEARVLLNDFAGASTDHDRAVEKKVKFRWGIQLAFSHVAVSGEHREKMRKSLFVRGRHLDSSPDGV